MAGFIEKRGKESYRLNYRKHRTTVRAKSERQAEKELAKFITEIEKGEYIEPSNQTFKEFALFWLEKYAKNHLKKSTIAGYMDMLESRIYVAIGHIPIDRLNPLHLQEFYSNLLEDGIRKDGKPGGLDPQTIKNHHTCISSILRVAKKWRVISSNVALDADPPKVLEKEMDYYSEEEVKNILSVLKDEDIKYYLLITLAIMTGLRKGELLGIEWDAINFETKELTIKKTRMYNRRFGVYEDDPKSDSSKRTIALSEVEIKLLRDFKELQQMRMTELGDLWENHNAIFTQWNGVPMHPGTVNNSYDKILKANNIPKKSFHSLRHSNITLLIAKNVDIKTVIHRVGHQDGTLILNRYSHALKSQDQKAANTLKDALFG